jgi:hypothetical protein
MLESKGHSGQPLDECLFEAVLKLLLAECEAAGQYKREDKATILSMCARVPADRRLLYLARLAAISPEPDARGGKAYQKVVQLIDQHRQPEWTNAELQMRLAATGTKIDAKQAGNFAAYLVKCGRFQRLARGHYRDRFGNVVVTSDDLPTWNDPEGSDE